MRCPPSDSDYLGSNISSTESDVDICTCKAETATERLLTIWKSDLSAAPSAGAVEYTDFLTSVLDMT